ncbi:hypothetical protein CP968_33230 [Streptomyces subrutilus]|uniref:Uncharacterized protein n=1 Tax=Streptomyces subrutilus TaxID=36818 RepID=A0A5P2UT02_9ACTN|nr:hypothetical protein CP968_33230 [Streptomyces subrutilus]
MAPRLPRRVPANPRRGTGPGGTAGRGAGEYRPGAAYGRVVGRYSSHEGGPVHTRTGATADQPDPDPKPGADPDPKPGADRPAQVPPAAERVKGRGTGASRDVVHRYGVLNALLEGGVDRDRIEVFHDVEDGGVHWVVTLDGGRAAILTDDTEEHVVHMEGPWPYKAVFLGPDGVRTRINHSIGVLTDRIVDWYARATGGGA